MNDMNVARNMEILLVEDSEDDLELTLRAFKRASFTNVIHVARDGEQGLDFLFCRGNYADREFKDAPKLVLLDLKLPGKSGLEVLAWIRNQDNELKELPVIVLTSSRQKQDIDQAYALGAHSYMAKPEGNFDELAEMVKAINPNSSVEIPGSEMTT